MDFNSDFLPAMLSRVLFGVVILLSAIIIRQINWRTFLSSHQLTAWICSVVFLSMIWIMRASLDSGVNIHLLGSMLLTLMFGWHLAILALSLVCIIVCLWGNIAFSNLGLAILINACFSVSICSLLFLIVEAYLPRNVFIYLFITAFLGTALSYALTGTVSAMFLGVFQVYDWRLIFNDYLPFYYLMSFAEAFTTCGLITLFIVYHPQLVYSFRDERYLLGK